MFCLPQDCIPRMYVLWRSSSDAPEFDAKKVYRMSRIATARSARSSKIFFRWATGSPPLRRPMIASSLSVLFFKVPRKSHFWPIRARRTTERPSFRRWAEAQQAISPLHSYRKRGKYKYVNKIDQPYSLSIGTHPSSVPSCLRISSLVCLGRHCQTPPRI